MCKPCRTLLTYLFLFLCEIFTKVQNWTFNILTLLVSLKTDMKVPEIVSMVTQVAIGYILF